MYFKKHDSNAILYQVPQDAQDYKAELKRIQDYVVDLHKRVMATCDSFSEDVKFWAEYKTGIRGFKPWLTAAEKTSTEGLSKPQTLDEANAMFAVVKAFEAGCLKHLKVNISIETLIPMQLPLFRCFQDDSTLSCEVLIETIGKSFVTFVYQKFLEKETIMNHSIFSIENAL